MKLSQRKRKHPETELSSNLSKEDEFVKKTKLSSTSTNTEDEIQCTSETFSDGKGCNISSIENYVRSQESNILSANSKTSVAKSSFSNDNSYLHSAHNAANISNKINNTKNRVLPLRDIKVEVLNTHVKSNSPSDNGMKNPTTIFDKQKAMTLQNKFENANSKLSCNLGISESVIQDIHHKQKVALEFFQVALSKFENVTNDLREIPEIFHKHNVGLEFCQVASSKFQSVSDDLQDLLETTVSRQQKDYNDIQPNSNSNEHFTNQELIYPTANIKYAFKSSPKEIIEIESDSDDDLYTTVNDKESNNRRVELKEKSLKKDLYASINSQDESFHGFDDLKIAEQSEETNESNQEVGQTNNEIHQLECENEEERDAIYQEHEKEKKKPMHIDGFANLEEKEAENNSFHDENDICDAEQSCNKTSDSDHEYNEKQNNNDRLFHQDEKVIENEEQNNDDVAEDDEKQNNNNDSYYQEEHEDGEHIKKINSFPQENIKLNKMDREIIKNDDLNLPKCRVKIISLNMEHYLKLVKNVSETSTIQDNSSSSLSECKDSSPRVNKITKSLEQKSAGSEIQEFASSKDGRSKVCSEAAQELMEHVSEEEIEKFCKKYSKVLKESNRVFTIASFPCPLCRNDLMKDKKKIKQHLQAIHQLSNDAIQILRTKVRMLVVNSKKLKICILCNKITIKYSEHMKKHHNSVSFETEFDLKHIERDPLVQEHEDLLQRFENYQKLKISQNKRKLRMREIAIPLYKLRNVLHFVELYKMSYARIFESEENCTAIMETIEEFFKSNPCKFKASTLRCHLDAAVILIRFVLHEAENLSKYDIYSLAKLKLNELRRELKKNEMSVRKINKETDRNMERMWTSSDMNAIYNHPYYIKSRDMLLEQVADKKNLSRVRDVLTFTILTKNLQRGIFITNMQVKNVLEAKFYQDTKSYCVKIYNYTKEMVKTNLYLCELTYLMLRRYIKYYRIFTPPIKEEFKDVVFLTQKGTPFTTGSLHNQHSLLVKQCGFKNKTGKHFSTTMLIKSSKMDVEVRRTLPEKLPELNDNLQENSNMEANSSLNISDCENTSKNSQVLKDGIQSEKDYECRAQQTPSTDSETIPCEENNLKCHVRRSKRAIKYIIDPSDLDIAMDSPKKKNL